MSRATRLARHIERTVTGPMWHGPALVDVLQGVDARRARTRPVAGAHSIWEITLHIATWERVGRRRLQESDPLDVSDEEDWPAVEDTSDEAWKNALEELRRNHEALREAIRGLDEARLEDIVPGTQYSIYFLLHGVIQHDLYHAGQIALLKKVRS